MSNLVNLIKEINQQINSVSFSYVYFEKETGKILRISNKKIDNYQAEYIKVETDYVRPILVGSKKIDDFVVKYDLSEKRQIIREKTYESELDSIKFKYYELPTVYTNDKINLEEIYQGVNVYLWHKDYFYSKGSIVWYNNSVYKLLDDNLSEQTFDQSRSEIYVENVLLTNLKTKTQKLNISNYFEKVYKNIHVDVWYEELDHLAGQHVWYNNAVYKILKDQKGLQKKEVEYVIQKTIQYSGIFVDVWYNELDHLAGQHVWYNNAVYKILKDQNKDTDFNLKNVKLIVDNVKLYNDSNKNLKFEKEFIKGDMILDNNKLYLVDRFEKIVKNKFCFENAELVIDNIKLYGDQNRSLKFNRNIQIGDIVLDNNSLYLFLEDNQNIDKSKSCLFYFNKECIVKYDKNQFYIFHTVKDSNKENLTNCYLDYEVTSSINLTKGQKILIGNQLFMVTDKKVNEADLMIIQDIDKEEWRISLDNRIKKEIKSNYNSNDILYFSVTAKHDPNILYRFFKVKLNDLLNNNFVSYVFENDWELNNNESSIYTPKYFNTYIHEVIE